MGRDLERALLDSLMRAGAERLLHVQGGAEVGKTCLLRWFERLAIRERWTVRFVDGAAVAARPSVMEEALRSMKHERSLLLVDSFDALGPLRAWLREEALPTLSLSTCVITAGRAPLGAEWTHDVGWRSLIREHRLTPWSVAELEVDRRAPLALIAPSRRGASEVRALRIDQAAFEDEVRRALRHFHRGDRLAQSALAAWLDLSGPDATRADTLREVLRDACASLGDEGVDAIHVEVLAATYFRGDAKQAAVAADLGMGYSTFRRHLATAVRRLSTALRQRC